jgi:hypothetical protein
MHGLAHENTEKMQHTERHGEDASFALKVTHTLEVFLKKMLRNKVINLYSEDIW